MKTLSRRFESTMMAATFAEAGEFDTAREVLKEEASLSKKTKALKDEVALTIDEIHAMANAFAEAGEFEKAREILRALFWWSNRALK